MTENPFQRGDTLSAVKSGPLDWVTAWRLMLRMLLNLLNASLTVLLLTACVIGVNQALRAADSSQTASRDLLLSGLGGVSAIAMGVSTISASRSGRWLGVSSVLLSVLSALVANVLQVSMVATVMWYPTEQRGCFGAMAGLGEALLVLAVLISGCLATISSGLLLWVSAPLRRR
ncbi:MAG: hypothetical protein ACKPJD_21590 [Planctomycetaceae bacterium]